MKLYDTNIKIWSKFVAGRVSTTTGTWRRYTSDWELLRLLRGFTFEFLEEPVQTIPKRELAFNTEERLEMEEQVQSLLEKGAIQPSQHQPGEFISNIFLREKKDKGKYRMILNLSDLNDFWKTTILKWTHWIQRSI